MKLFAYLSATLLVLLALIVAAAPKQTPTSQVHVRGTIVKASPDKLTVQTSTGPVVIAVIKPVQVTALIPSDRSKIQSNTFVGITSVPQPGGGQRAVEVHIFPESMRGAGEGSYPWDLSAGGKTTHSRMTNGAVGSSVAPAAHSRMTNGTVAHAGSTLVVTYKGKGGSGSQTIVIPPGIPIVTFKPGTPADLKPGAHVIIFATRDSKTGLHAGRVVVGEGVVPPM